MNKLLDTPLDRTTVRVITALMVPLLLWLFSIAWSSKVDRSEFDRHMADHAVQAEKIDEILCTIKPESRHCK